MRGQDKRLLNEAGYLLLGLIAVAVLTALCLWLDVPLVSAAFSYLIVIVLLSLVSSLPSLVILSVIAVGCLDYFFTVPFFSFTVDYRQDIIALATRPASRSSRRLDCTRLR
ncbi:DUF4118 domain-containing protein [Bradyrhizobium sp. Ash2021]|uniref:DUF4118 domain-containing protein n=1 Tax=Bradyrhizobium sp. Ash2021 TaxID=2954771 RepID=UPI0035C1391E